MKRLILPPLPAALRHSNRMTNFCPLSRALIRTFSNPACNRAFPFQRRCASCGADRASVQFRRPRGSHQGAGSLFGPGGLRGRTKGGAADRSALPASVPANSRPDGMVRDISLGTGRPSTCLDQTATR